MKRYPSTAPGLAILLWLLAVSAPACYGAESDITHDSPIVQVLEAQKKYANVIVAPVNQEATPGTMRHIMLRPETEQVVIQPTELNFKQEAASFASHRRHYLAYWSLFMAMLILDALGAE